MWERESHMEGIQNVVPPLGYDVLDVYNVLVGEICIHAGPTSQEDIQGSGCIGIITAERITFHKLTLRLTPAIKVK